MATPAPAPSGDGDRPRERFLAAGAPGVSTDELVALILGTGARGRSAVQVARELLAEVGGVVGLSRAAPRELQAVAGIGAARAARLAAAFHLGRRASEARERGTPVTSAHDVYRRLRDRLAGLSQEVFLVLALDCRNGVLDEIEVARGSLTAVAVHPREVFRPLIRQAAAAAVVVHNHPSGDPTPSVEDVMLTRRLRSIGELIGIPLVDHVVIGDTSYASIAELLGAEAPEALA